MQSTINRRDKSFCLVLVVVFIGVMQAASAWGQLQMGIAVRDVTPEPLLPVSGGVGPAHPTTKKFGRLTVRALVLEEGDTRAAICSGDFLGFPGPLCEKVRRQAPSVPPENILIGATHNHSGPDCYGFPDGQGGHGAVLEYLDGVCRKLAEAIEQAAARLQPVRVKIATGEARGKIAYNYYAEQLFDPRCHVIQFIDKNNEATATLINYACHPEVIGSDQGILCPDFVGPLYDRIREKTGGTGIFMNGALGGMVTADCRGSDGKEIHTWRECTRIGNLLADEALRIVGEAAVVEAPALTCHSTTIEFPVTNELMQTIMNLSPLGYKPPRPNYIATRLNVINLADAQMLSVPGEALPNIGAYLQRKMQGKHNLLLGLTNDAFGYILIKEDWNAYDRYRYISRTSLGELTGDIYIEQALKFLDSLPRPE